MERIFDNQKEELKKLILTMGGNVESALDEAIQSLLRRNGTGFQAVHAIEARINADQIKVDNACVSYLAKQTPVAGDLRLIISIIKINADLERMGDQCVNIAHSGREYLGRGVQFSDLSHIQKMATDVKDMIKTSLDSFVQGNSALAETVLLKDDGVDRLKHEVFREMSAHMKSNPGEIEAALDLILIARNLERLGDHATNIAEDVIFASTGKDVRHGGKFTAS